MIHRILRIFVPLVGIWLLAAAAQAQTATFSAGLFSQYVVDNGDQVYNKPVIQSDVTLSFKSGAYANLWGSAGENGGREVDYTLGWANKYVDASAWYLVHAGGSPANIFQVTVKVGYPIEIGKHAVHPYLRVDDITVTNSHGDDGIFRRLGLNDSWALNDKLALTQGAWVLHDSGIFKKEAGLVARYELGVEMKKKNFTLKPTATLSVPIDVNDRETQFVGGFKIIM